MLSSVSDARSYFFMSVNTRKIMVFHDYGLLLGQSLNSILEFLLVRLPHFSAALRATEHPEENCRSSRFLYGTTSLTINPEIAYVSEQGWPSLDLPLGIPRRELSKRVLYTMLSPSLHTSRSTLFRYLPKQPCPPPGENPPFSSQVSKLGRITMILRKYFGSCAGSCHLLRFSHRSCRLNITSVYPRTSKGVHLTVHGATSLSNNSRIGRVAKTTLGKFNIK